MAGESQDKDTDEWAWLEAKMKLNWSSGAVLFALRKTDMMVSYKVA